MKMTFRWYGAETDPITLENIRQIPGVSGIMGAMDWIPVGEMCLMRRFLLTSGKSMTLVWNVKSLNR